MSTEQNVATLAAPPQPRYGVRRLFAGLREASPQGAVLNGSLVMLFGSGVVSALNFGYNVAMARLLGPASFGYVSAVATLLMMASAMTLSFQLVGAKFIAKNSSREGRLTVYRDMALKAWVVGAAVFIGLTIASPLISSL